jgi:hypothetical protein
MGDPCSVGSLRANLSHLAQQLRRLPSPSPEDGNTCSFRNVVLLTMGKVQNLNKSELITKSSFFQFHITPKMVSHSHEICSRAPGLTRSPGWTSPIRAIAHRTPMWVYLSFSQSLDSRLYRTKFVWGVKRRPARKAFFIEILGNPELYYK